MRGRRPTSRIHWAHRLAMDALGVCRPVRPTTHRLRRLNAVATELTAQPQASRPYSCQRHVDGRLHSTNRVRTLWPATRRAGYRHPAQLIAKATSEPESMACRGRNRSHRADGCHGLWREKRPVALYRPVPRSTLQMMAEHGIIAHGPGVTCTARCAALAAKSVNAAETVILG